MKRPKKGEPREWSGWIGYHPNFINVAQHAARELFWFSKKNVDEEKQRAVHILKGILVNDNPMSEEQITAVLHGNSYLKGIQSERIPRAKYVNKIDRKFKKLLGEVRANKPEIAGRRIDKMLIDQYVEAKDRRTRTLLWRWILKDAGFTDDEGKRIITYRILSYKKGFPVKDYSDYLDFKNEFRGYVKSTYGKQE